MSSRPDWQAKQARCPRCGVDTHGSRGTLRGCNDCWKVDPEYMRQYSNGRRSKTQLQKAS